MKIVPPTPEGLAEAAEIIFDGGIVAYPTDTVYGLAVDPFIEEAVERLFEAKGRDNQNPILLVIDDEEDLYDVVGDISDRAAAFIEAFWPGPLSILLPKSPELPEAVTAGEPNVCVRCPDFEIARDLCRVYGGALTSSSANRSGQPPAMSVDELEVPGVDLVIDGGRLPETKPSTVFDPEDFRILRAGAITESQLRAVWDEIVRNPG